MWLFNKYDAKKVTSHVIYEHLFRMNVYQPQFGIHNSPLLALILVPFSEGQWKTRHSSWIALSTLLRKHSKPQTTRFKHSSTRLLLFQTPALESPFSRRKPYRFSWNYFEWWGILQNPRRREREELFWSLIWNRLHCIRRYHGWDTMMNKAWWWLSPS